MMAMRSSKPVGEFGRMPCLSRTAVTRHAMKESMQSAPVPQEYSAHPFHAGSLAKRRARTKMAAVSDPKARGALIP